MQRGKTPRTKPLGKINCLNAEAAYPRQEAATSSQREPSPKQGFIPLSKARAPRCYLLQRETAVGPNLNNGWLGSTEETADNWPD